MQIAGYLKTSLIEWPGKISSVIFTQGCNFRCPFCHNRELVNGKMTGLQDYSEQSVLKDLESRRKWVDSVVITGGEPTIQEDLPEFLKKVGELGFLTMIHTNGTRPDALASILNFKFQILNFIAMDLKGDLENYSNYTNYSNDQIIKNVKESMRLIIKSGVEYEFRTTVVPTLHNKKNLICLAEQIRFLVQSSKFSPPMAVTASGGIPQFAVRSRPKAGKVQSCRWFLQQFRPMNTLDKKFLKVKPFSKEKMEGFQKELRKIIPGTLLRGV